MQIYLFINVYAYRLSQTQFDPRCDETCAEGPMMSVSGKAAVGVRRFFWLTRAWEGGHFSKESASYRELEEH